MTREAFLTRDKRKGTASHRRAPKQERELAKRLGGKVTPGSGNGTIKGDVRVEGILRVEAKTTKYKSFSVTLSMIEKIEHAALGAGEAPCIVIEFHDGRGNKVKEVAVVPTYVLDSLIHK
jgi:Holliday junction resolvase